MASSSRPLRPGPTRIRSRWAAGLAAGLTAALALVGCSPTPAEDPSGRAPTAADVTWSGSPEDQPDTWAENLDPDSKFGLHRRAGLEPELQPETRILTEAETAGLTEFAITNEAECLAEADERPMCEFALTFATLPDGVEVGSVLNAGITPTTPAGMLVKVTAVEGNRLTGVQATLQDALVQGEFWVEKVFDTAELRADPVLAPGVTVTPRLPEGSGGTGTGVAPTFDELSLPGALTLDVEPVDGVHVTGSLDFGAGCGLDGGVGGSDIAWVELSCQAWESASLRVHSETGGPASTERYTVAVFPLAGFVVPIGPLVIVVLVDILVTVDLSGQVHVGMDYQASEYAEVYGGLKFSLGDGLDHHGGVKTSASSSGAELSAPVSAAAVGRAEVRISAYGVLGLGTGGEASLTLNGSPDQNPRWRVLGNAAIFARVFLGILGFELTAQIKYSLKEPYEIRAWKNEPPELTLVWPGHGENITLGGMVRQVEARAKDPEDGELPVTWTDLTTGDTVTGTGPLNLPLAAPGAHKLRITATDSAGEVAQLTVKVTVGAPSLELTLRQLTIEGAELDGPPSGKSGSTLLVEATVKSGQLLGGASCADIVWSASNATVQSDGGCRPTVVLGQPGTATVNARVTDSYGTSATAALTLNVAAAPATVTPQFRGIDARSQLGSLEPGTPLMAQMPVTLSVTYLNKAQAGTAVNYRWTVSANGGAEQVLPAAASEGETSSRSYTPPTAYGHKASFTVVVTDAGTGKVLTTRTLAVSWTSAPK